MGFSSDMIGWLALMANLINFLFCLYVIMAIIWLVFLDKWFIIIAYIIIYFGFCFGDRWINGIGFRILYGSVYLLLLHLSSSLWPEFFIYTLNPLRFIQLGRIGLYLFELKWQLYFGSTLHNFWMLIFQFLENVVFGQVKPAHAGHTHLARQLFKYLRPLKFNAS